MPSLPGMPSHPLVALNISPSSPSRALQGLPPHLHLSFLLTRPASHNPAPTCCCTLCVCGLHGLAGGWILVSIHFLNLGTRVYIAPASLSRVHNQHLERAVRMGSLKHRGLEEGGNGAARPREVTSASFPYKNVWKLCPTLSRPVRPSPFVCMAIGQQKLHLSTRKRPAAQL